MCLCCFPTAKLLDHSKPATVGIWDVVEKADLRQKPPNANSSCSALSRSEQSPAEGAPCPA